MSQQSPTRRSFEVRSPPLVMSPVDERLALVMKPPTAPARMMAPKIASRIGIRRLDRFEVQRRADALGCRRQGRGRG
jgi:hypothetical protein